MRRYGPQQFPRLVGIRRVGVLANYLATEVHARFGSKELFFAGGYEQALCIGQKFLSLIAFWSYLGTFGGL